jgi:hypothetical protein
MTIAGSAAGRRGRSLDPVSIRESGASQNDEKQRTGRLAVNPPVVCSSV